MPHQNLSANERTTVVTVSRRSLPRPRKKRKPNKTEVVKNLIKHLTKTAMEICIKGTFKKKASRSHFLPDTMFRWCQYPKFDDDDDSCNEWHQISVIFEHFNIPSFRHYVLTMRVINESNQIFRLQLTRLIVDQIQALNLLKSTWIWTSLSPQPRWLLISVQNYTKINKTNGRASAFAFMFVFVVRNGCRIHYWK